MPFVWVDLLGMHVLVFSVSFHIYLKSIPLLLTTVNFAFNTHTFLDFWNFWWKIASALDSIYKPHTSAVSIFSTMCLVGYNRYERVDGRD